MIWHIARHDDLMLIDINTRRDMPMACVIGFSDDDISAAAIDCRARND